MDWQQVRKIRSTTAVVGNWYRVGGTRAEPTFEKIVVWAVFAITDRSGTEVYHGPDVIVGLGPSELGPVGCDLPTVMCSNGYVELSDDEVTKVKREPSILPGYLVWED
jgi:hypothetical protein